MAKKTYKINVDEYTYKKLMDDRDLYTLSIGTCKWTIDMVIREYFKIMPEQNAVFFLKGKEVKWEEIKKYPDKYIPLLQEEFPHMIDYRGKK